jgi:hypothetical protein
MLKQTVLGQERPLRGKPEEQKVSPDPEQSRGDMRDASGADMDKSHQQSTPENDCEEAGQLEHAKINNYRASV